jgi:uncharacterized protein YbaR (Trm112 family)
MNALQSLPPEWLDLLCCPESHQPLAPAEPALLERLNASIRAGEVRNRGGAAIIEGLESGLVRQDGRFVYPVRNGIPVLLVDEALPI